MNLIRTSILTLISTAVKMAAGLVINKAVAVYIGPTGLALVGQFQNFNQLMMTAAQGAINNGVTKYVAEYGKDGDRIPALLSTAVRISLSSSALVGLGIIVFANYASTQILKSDHYGYIFVILGFTISLFVLNNLLLSILNGLREIKIWVAINIIQSIYGLIFTTLLIKFLGLDGILIALATNQSVIFFILLWMLRGHKIINLENFKRPFDKPEAKKLAAFAAMAVVSAITVPVSHLVIRNYIGTTLGWDEAGYWQAMWYISTMYLMAVTTTLSIYYLPKLSEITDKATIRSELWHGYKIIMPLVAITSVGIFLMKDYIIALLFTNDFLPIRQLFLWQLVGDVLKVASWLFAYLMVAKSMSKTFIVTEISFSLSLVLLARWLVGQYGLVGISYAFAANYAIYLIVIIFVTKRAWAGA